MRVTLRWGGSSRARVWLLLAAVTSCNAGSPGLRRVTLAPDSFSLGLGLSRQLVVTASYSDGSTDGVTGLAGWSSSTPQVATVAGGLVSGVSTGTATIIATLGKRSDTSVVTIAASLPTLSHLSVAPVPARISIAGSRPLVATARYSDSSTSVVTGQATWLSLAPRVAQVSAGVVTGVAAGRAGIIASFAGRQDTAEVTVTHTQIGAYSYPLKLGPDGRHLVDQNDIPFLMVGDAGWSLIAQLTDEEADAYLARRAEQGFNVVMVNLIEHKFATNAPANIYREAPFTGAPFTTPNEAYFVRADRVIKAAARHGIVLLLAPAYVGIWCTDEGWCSEMLDASKADLTAWGRFVGARYRDYDNIIWLIGGDADPIQTGVKSRLQAVVNGIQQRDSRHLFTPHGASGQLANAPWKGAGWLTINNAYSYDSTLYQLNRMAYHEVPVRPYFLIESSYEGDKHNPSPAVLRAQSYWTVLSGGLGHIYGACPMWHFGAPSASKWCPSADWRGQLSSPGAESMGRFGKLFVGRHWHTLVPDESHRALTQGYGDGADYAAAAIAADGSSIIAYLPSARRVTVAGSPLAGSAMTAWWYNPATGVSTRIGGYPTAGTQDFAPPVAGDWVLVLDSDSFGFSSP